MGADKIEWGRTNFIWDGIYCICTHTLNLVSFLNMMETRKIFINGCKGYIFLFSLGRSSTLKLVSTPKPPTLPPPGTCRPLLGKVEAEIWFVDFTHKYKINPGVFVGWSQSLGWLPSNYNLFCRM